jgi:hypothetical protein
MKTILIACVTFLIMGQTAFAGITCSSDRMQKDLVISKSSVAFNEYHDSSDSRSIASSNLHGVRTQKTIKGFNKIVFFEGQKHTIHIDDVSNFSDVNDYITIRSQKGHEIIYPISCQNS